MKRLVEIFYMIVRFHSGMKRRYPMVRFHSNMKRLAVRFHSSMKGLAASSFSFCLIWCFTSMANS